ncbi:Na/Pi cotransporter family protein, partial [Candidatus Puniceispirillum sp.]|nr:Na/Pi cotransporter family protein [Candidatus Puniceispirillum sp.]
PITTFFFGAVFTWLIHSSIASLLLIIAFVAQAIVPTDVAVTLVLGANTGGAFIAVILARNLNTRGQVVPLSNFCLRGVSAVLVLAIIHILGMPSILSNFSSIQQIISFHIGFNMLLVVIGLPFIKPITAVLLKIMSDGGIDNEQPLSSRPSGLKEADIKLPARALAATTRELLYLAESVQIMFAPAMDLYENFDKVEVKELKKLEIEISGVHAKIKKYLAEVSQQNLSEDQLKRNGDLMMFADNMAAAADVIVNRLLKLAKERNEKALVFSDEGWRELLALHDRVLANMQLAMNVLVSSDLETARQLVIEKNELSSMTQKSLSKHLERLSRHKTKSLETSNMHNETLRGLRQINSSFSSIAYSILDDAGQLRKTRLAK